MGMTFEHRQHMGLNHMGLNNRAKNAHLPTLRRKRIMKRIMKWIMKWIMKRFTSARHLKRLVFIHDGVANLHTCPRHAMSSSDDRALRSGAMVAWRKIAEPGIAAQRQGTAPREKRPVFARPPFGKLTVPSSSPSASTRRSGKNHRPATTANPASDPGSHHLQVRTATSDAMSALQPIACS
jgi:hypothetical protein